MSIKLSWKNRVEKASKVLGITSEKFEEILNGPDYQLMTMDESDRLSLMDSEETMPFGDLRKLFVEDNKIPLPKLRLAVKYIRGLAEDSSEKTALEQFQEEFKLKPSVSNIPLAKLLSYYDPKNNSIPQVSDQLEKLQAQYGNFIAYKPGTSELAIEEIAGYIEDRKAGFPAQTFIQVGGMPSQLYKVGEAPDVFLDEDPLFSGSPLRRGRSTHNQLDWTKISHEIRTLVRILKERNCKLPNDTFSLQQFIEQAVDKIANQNPEAFLEWQNRKALGTLPSLKVTPNNNKKQNPFNPSYNVTR